MKDSNTMTDELMPDNCPCCGSPYAQFVFEVDDMGRVICQKCGLKTQLTTKTNAIAAWNTRHKSDDIPGWLKLLIEDRIDNIHATERLCRCSKECIEELNRILSLKRGE